MIVALPGLFSYLFFTTYSFNVRMPKQVAGKYKTKTLMLINFFYDTIPHIKSRMDRFISFFTYDWRFCFLRMKVD